MSATATLKQETLEAIIEAHGNPDKLPNLFKYLDPILYSIARRIAWQIVDDAVQAAHVRIWKKLHKVDLSRPETAKAFIMKAAVSGMRDEVRKYLRQTRLSNANIDNVDPRNFKKDPRPDKPEVVGVLELYIQHIERTGDFQNAHKEVGKILGVSTARASTKFHEASRDYIELFEKETK